MKIFALIIVPLLLSTVTIKPVYADEIRVAVASNFSETIKFLVSKFESNSEHKIKLIFGATGRHYAQIKNGAPFDLFFAADSKRPQLLETEELIVEGSRFTYARGKLVLWSPDDKLIDSQAQVLADNRFNHIAIANPKLAPYGYAAKEFLSAKKLWEPLKKKAVRGENIGQAFHFVSSGNAELGLVAYSQVKHPVKTIKGSYWEIPSALYSPIDQQAVILKASNAANEFIAYIKSDEAKTIIQSFGYESVSETLGLDDSDNEAAKHAQ